MNRKLKRIFGIAIVGYTSTLLGDSTWIGTGSDDMTDPNNWSPNGVPTGITIADFDSAYMGVNFTESNPRGRNGFIANLNTVLNIAKGLDAYVELSSEFFGRWRSYSGSIGLNSSW